MDKSIGKRRLIVIGGGAAGFFCAVNAARMDPLLEVIILEKSSKILSKVRISGGGRCNVTHACFSIAEMLKHYPRGSAFLKKPFHQFFTTDTINWFSGRGVPLITEADGRMFPESNSSASIIDCLLKEAKKYNVEIRMNASVEKIEVNDLSAKGSNTGTKKFVVYMGNKSTLAADAVLVASGGYPNAAQFAWLYSTGHAVETPVPSLFTFNFPGNPITKLMGVSVGNALVKIAGTRLQQEGPLLITHWGLSGPAALKLSAWAARELAGKKYNADIVVNWVPGEHEQSLLEKFKQWRFQLAPQKLINRNPLGLPARLWEFFMQQSGIPETTRWADLPAKEQNIFIRQLCQSSFAMKGKTTFKEEFVTAGGILLSSIDPNRMESKLLPGLFFAGEVMDVDGVTGGFNFQHAWTSGWVAANAITTIAHD